MSEISNSGFPEEADKPERIIAFEEVLEMLEAEAAGEAAEIFALEELIASIPIPDPFDPEAVAIFAKEMEKINQASKVVLAKSEFIKSFRERITKKIEGAS